MAHKTDYTWKDVGDIAKADGSETTQAEKEAIAKQWNEINKPSGETDQNLANFHRSERNALLAETDWMASSDLTMSDEWKTYRQALRDLPNHSNFPNLTEQDYPTKPS